MTNGRWRARALIAIGALMSLLTGAALVLQSRDAHDTFIVVALFQGALYLAAVWLILRGAVVRRGLLMILGVAAFMRLGIVLAPPYLSDDLYRYVWDGRVEAAGINPYRYVPADTRLAELRDEAIYPNINRRTYARTIYPPVAEYIFFLVTRISESAMLMKVTMVAFELACVGILLRLLALAGLPLERILIYAWHPLTLWEFAGSGHIDAAILAFVAVALWARRREAAWLTGIALACATLVKFFPIVIFPALYRRWDWRMPVAAAAAAIVAYLPFLGAGPAILGFLPGYVSEEGLDRGTGFFLWNLLNAAVPLANVGVIPYLAVAAAVLASLGLYIILSDKAGERYVAAAAALAAAFTVLMSPHFPWYFVWMLAFLCLAPSAALLYLSIASLLLYFVSGGPDLDGSRMLVECAVYGPFAVLAVIELRRGWVAGPAPALLTREA
jgi:alpha-1,6-mannosyltransferase